MVRSSGPVRISASSGHSIWLARCKKEAISLTSTLGSPGNALVEVDALDGAGSSLTELLLGSADERDAAWADETARVGKVALIVLLQLLHDTHLFQNADSWGANGITTVLVTGKLLLVQKSNLAKENAQELPLAHNETQPGDVRGTSDVCSIRVQAETGPQVVDKHLRL